MQIAYSQEADVLLIKLREGVPVDSVDLSEGMIVHYDEGERPIKIEILDASRLVYLDEIDVSLKEMLRTSETVAK